MAYLKGFLAGQVPEATRLLDGVAVPEVRCLLDDEASFESTELLDKRRRRSSHREISARAQQEHILPESPCHLQIRRQSLENC